MCRIFGILVLMLFVCFPLMSEEICMLSSPDGNIEMKINKTSPYTTAAVYYRGEVIVPEIRLGMQEINQTFYENMKFLGVSPKKKINEEYTAIHGKKSSCFNQGNAMTLFLENPQKRKLNIEFRVYNDGICFRYNLLDHKSDSLCFVKEFTSYRIPKEADRWMQKYIPHYEGDFPHEKDKNSQGEWGYPALICFNNNWALFTEANIERTYCATHLSNINDSELYQVTYPGKDEGNGIGSVYSYAQSPWHSPWRVIILGELKNIVESTLVEDVSKPCLLEKTDWIQPGSASWIYWAYNHGTKDYKICCEYVDLAAAMRWKYVLFDWEWDQMQNGGTLEDAVSYAHSKGVKPLIWYNSGGEHNRVASTPRDRLITSEQRHKEFAKLKEMGFAGIKVDFFESDKQQMMNYYIDILEDAATYELMVNFHGCTLPRGWERTYPHLMSMEAVYGAEQYNNSAYMTEAAPRLNCIYPFTRNVVGPMDYTPVAFTDSQHPHRTSYAHELALSVVFESAIQHWADRPEGFYQLPEEVRNFMSNVPTAWDETLFVEGYPGRSVILARRKGDSWYVAGINGTENPQELVINLSFLSSGNYQLTLFADGNAASELNIKQKIVNKKDTLSVKWLSQGGFVATIKRSRE